MAKNIIFCADGTWNNPYEDENGDSTADPTNVYKLFLCLDGAFSPGSLCDADEQEKESVETGETRQVAKYLHGVGDSRNPIVKLMGGTFGAGIISRIVRGYTFISRNYQSGDKIYIAGFSRGAYTARALAGLIVSQGLLAPALTLDREQAYRAGAQAWYRYRQTLLAAHPGLAKLAEIVADLPAFLSSGSLKESDLVPVDNIAAVAVWDTVGALGLPEYKGGKDVDAFKFADTRLSDRVLKGFQAVALDEQRETFTPTLWDDAGNVNQTLFPGAHADVGGGYPTANNESGLSDVALQWIIEQLQGEVRFAAPLPYALNPDSAGTAHKPWTHAPWPLFPTGPRDFKGVTGIRQDPSIATRKAAGNVIAEPGEEPAPYDPRNLP